MAQAVYDAGYGNENFANFLYCNGGSVKQAGVQRDDGQLNEYPMGNRELYTRGYYLIR